MRAQAWIWEGDTAQSSGLEADSATPAVTEGRGLQGQEPTRTHSYLDYGIHICSKILQPLQVSLPLPVTPPVSLRSRREGNPEQVFRAGWRRGRGRETGPVSSFQLCGEDSGAASSRVCPPPPSLVPADTHALAHITATKPAVQCRPKRC